MWIRCGSLSPVLCDGSEITLKKQRNGLCEVTVRVATTIRASKNNGRLDTFFSSYFRLGSFCIRVSLGGVHFPVFLEFMFSRPCYRVRNFHLFRGRWKGKLRWYLKCRLDAENSPHLRVIRSSCQHGRVNSVWVMAAVSQAFLYQNMSIIINSESAAAIRNRLFISVKFHIIQFYLFFFLFWALTSLKKNYYVEWSY